MNSARERIMESMLLLPKGKGLPLPDAAVTNLLCGCCRAGGAAINDTVQGWWGRRQRYAVLWTPIASPLISKQLHAARQAAPRAHDELVRFQEHKHVERRQQEFAPEQRCGDRREVGSVRDVQTMGPTCKPLAALVGERFRQFRR